MVFSLYHFVDPRYLLSLPPYAFPISLYNLVMPLYNLVMSLYDLVSWRTNWGWRWSN